MANDLINHPKHYTDQAITLEPIDYCRLLPFSLGNAMKYVFRAGHKKGESELKDLKKAQFYLEDHIRKDSWIHPKSELKFVELARPTLSRSENPIIRSAMMRMDDYDLDTTCWLFEFTEDLRLEVDRRIEELEASRD